MSLGAWIISILLVNMALLAGPAPTLHQTTIKVGAWVDDASRHNFGVRVNIETHTYNMTPDSLQYFWVGDDLSNGAFIQFGYALEPGIDCLQGTVTSGILTCQENSEPIANSDARWQWQYWPNSSKPNFYFEIGPRGSGGANATSQEYTILPSPSGTWDFTINGTTVAETNFPVSPSTEPALIIAEGTIANESSPLGPVRFSGLSYFDGQEWKSVDSLIAVTYCDLIATCVANQYGVTSTGTDSIVVGSGATRAPNDTLLWSLAEETLQVQVHPGLQFLVATTIATQPYYGYATLKVPKGMFAYISLPQAETGTTGILGLFGGKDHFNGWMGAVKSSNLSVQVLMNADENVTANWTTDTTVPTAVAVSTAIILLVLSFTLMRRRSLKHKRGV